MEIAGFSRVSQIANRWSDVHTPGSTVSQIDAFLQESVAAVTQLSVAGGSAGRVGQAQFQRLTDLRLLLNSIGAHSDPQEVCLGIDHMLRRMQLVPAMGMSDSAHLAYLSRIYAGLEVYPLSRNPIVGVSRFLGEGCYSETFEGVYRDVIDVGGAATARERPVAYKMLRPEKLETNSSISSGGIWGDMAHVGIDFGVDGPPPKPVPQNMRSILRPYLVLPLYGSDLDREIQKLAQLTPHERLKETMLILRAGSKEHGRGVIHGDIRPPNIFRNKDGQGWVLGDFGMSIRRGSNQKRTVAHPCLHNEPAAVQNMRQPRHFISQDETSDVLYMGVTLLELWLNKGIKFADLTRFQYNPNSSEFEVIPKDLREILHMATGQSRYPDLEYMYYAILLAYPKFASN